jgi:hypothetical protein
MAATKAHWRCSYCGCMCESSPAWGALWHVSELLLSVCCCCVLLVLIALRGCSVSAKQACSWQVLPGTLDTISMSEMGGGVWVRCSIFLCLGCCQRAAVQKRLTSCCIQLTRAGVWLSRGLRKCIVKSSCVLHWAATVRWHWVCQRASLCACIVESLTVIGCCADEGVALVLRA